MRLKWLSSLATDVERDAAASKLMEAMPFAFAAGEIDADERYPKRDNKLKQTGVVSSGAPHEG